MNNNKPNILVFIDWFLPAFKAGGPIQSIHNIVLQMSHEFNFYIVTSNCDIDGELNLSDNILNTWIQKEIYFVIYLDQAHQTKEMFKKIFQERIYAAIYLNSLFSTKFTLLTLRLFIVKKMKIILAPRGMLGNGALSIKPLKKKLFLYAFKLFNCHKKITWHATSEKENEEIRYHFGQKVKIHKVSNLCKNVQKQITSKLKTENKLHLFYLSRISFKKNLLAAIRSLKDVSTNYQIIFTIVGPIEDIDYWKKCNKEIKLLPMNIKVVTKGAVPNYSLHEVLQDQHVLLLPTRHENFGHVVVESWQNGCPVIISDQTPWHNLAEERLGIEIPLNNIEGYTKYIEYFAKMNQIEFEKWSKSSYNKAIHLANELDLKNKYREMFAITKETCK